MKLIKGKDAIFETDNYDVILIGTSIYDILTHGFQGKVAIKYPHVAEANHKQPYGDSRRLGKRVTVEKEGCPTISLLYICRYPKKGLKSLDYDALKHCLETSAAEFKNKRIITTIMGASDFDGEGDRAKILRWMRKYFKDMDVDVYDYPQIKVIKELNETSKKLKSMGVDKRSKRREILERLFLMPKNGEKQ